MLQTPTPRCHFLQPIITFSIVSEAEYCGNPRSFYCFVPKNCPNDRGIFLYSLRQKKRQMGHIEVLHSSHFIFWPYFYQDKATAFSDKSNWGNLERDVTWEPGCVRGIFQKQWPLLRSSSYLWGCENKGAAEKHSGSGFEEHTLGLISLAFHQYAELEQATAVMVLGRGRDEPVPHWSASGVKGFGSYPSTDKLQRAKLMALLLHFWLWAFNSRAISAARWHFSKM